MPRKQYVADLAAAAAGTLIAGISNVCPGDDDGEFTFACIAEGDEIKVSALIPELSEYPSSHDCMIFGPDNASASVASILADISARGKTVHQILELVSRKLESTDNDGDRHMMNSQNLDDLEDGSDDDDDFDEEYFPGDEDFTSRSFVVGQHALAAGAHANPTAEFRQRIRRDFQAAKSIGFKVGYLGGLMDGLGCYVSISVRMSKLGISAEAMQAWQVEPKEYLVMLCHYPAGYITVEEYQSCDSSRSQTKFGMRIGICKSYKPTISEAVQAFTVLSKEDEQRQEESQQTASQQQVPAHQGFRHSFISRPLNELFAQRFPMLLKFRYGGMDWNGAEMFFGDQVLQPMSRQTEALDDKYHTPEVINASYSPLVTADHILQSSGQEHSLPVIAMQFGLRHFVRCTEFCLICFSKMTDDLQAIKPYVCDNPLCLYQYMSLGFGPSIEHEVLSQPKVVDLLISFCYRSARATRLKTFPSGLALMVPPACSYEGDYPLNQYYGHMGGFMGRHNQPEAPASKKPAGSSDIAPMEARINAGGREIMFEDKGKPCPVRANEWITFRFNDDPNKPWHCRVLETTYYPTIKISEPLEPAVTADAVQSQGRVPGTAMAGQSGGSTSAPKPGPVPRKPDELRPAKFQIYNQNFDELTDENKRQVICLLLDLLPPVKVMKQYLLRSAQSSLSSWIDRLSPAALGLLRWIIASNRACIVQVDTEGDVALGRKAEDRLYGMSNWHQFRFAMGAPDKERRFVQSVRSVTDRLHLRYPTLFAWHGSPLHNWHSIIREGLHFNETLNGRAFGNGVYHSLDVHTSIGYSGYGSTGSTWSNSELNVQQALALNEICNAPNEFVSRSPHLVVAQLDWIQTRYLFISSEGTQNSYHTGPNPSSDKGSMPLDVLEQDPSMTPNGSDGKLMIPVHAVAGSRRPKALTTAPHKKRKAQGTSKYDAIEVEDDDDTASVATLEEDRAILEYISPDDDQVIALPTPSSTTNGKRKQIHNLTDYVPGTLDYSKLPMLQQPCWASPSATMGLMRDFRALIKTQNEQPLHELGWHIDEEKMENIYQWIVELHSFDAKLPLAQDMKKRNLSSVVLELRFGKEYPMAPPFVRVIRPRFLSFAAGGGGHVTAGGAMCMELLTNDGWSAASSIESVLVQVRMAITSLDPKPARLESGVRADYGVGEAVDAYMRACAVHGWSVPAGFKETAYGGAVGGSHPDSMSFPGSFAS
ncbi:hypothetical protein E8E13_010886 [Curvularia kusanoi]|uniref:UBC core domain-containing protein n=1 Tax=Curvularia kusanoi TaxID=90978 RepID=A0A9P4TJQ5_CURKU|nr:hypothetical protein E8E13_010886 [Curvularia kusanoi]